MLQVSGHQTFLSEGHITYYRTCRRPNVLRNVVVSGFVAFYQINKFSENILFFLSLTKWLRGAHLARGP